MDTEKKLHLATVLCERKKIRLTHLRQKVLNLLYQATHPVSAYALLSRLRQTKPNAEPPTIYRALDFLCMHQLAHRIETNNTYIACTHPHEQHKEQMLTCTKCGRVVEIDDPAFHRALLQNAQKNLFHPATLRIEIQGVCLDCTKE